MPTGPKPLILKDLQGKKTVGTGVGTAVGTGVGTGVGSGVGTGVGSALEVVGHCPRGRGGMQFRFGFGVA
jgi:hypothetical protein